MGALLTPTSHFTLIWLLIDRPIVKREALLPLFLTNSRFLNY